MSFVNRSRRVGQRRAAPGIVLSWNTGGRRSPRWGHRHFEEADVIDVSVTGAQVLAPDNHRIVVGQRVTVVAGGAIGEVRVMRVVSLSQRQLAVYGVEFITLEPALESLLLPILHTEAPKPAAVVWS